MKRKFLFLISPKTHFLDLAGPDQVIFESIFFEAPFEIIYCCYMKDTKTASGLTFTNLQNYSKVQLKDGDFIFVPGMDIQNFDDMDSTIKSNLLKWLNKSYQNGVSICSVCTGAFILGEAGLLNDKNSTTHWKYTSKLQERFPTAKIQNNVLYTDDNNIYTSAGIASGIDLALYIVEKIMGGYFSFKVAREIVVFNRREGNHVQQNDVMSYRNHIHNGVHEVQEWIYNNIHKKTSIETLANIASMSTRNFTRIFKQETTLTINQYINKVRLDKATEHLQNPNLTRLQIAKKVGLTSERQLGRLISQR
jgi:transcriptional regulator GlxA family with amidase domain